MIIFLYGPDNFRSQKKLNEIVNYYKKIHKSGLNLKYFEGGKLNFEDFHQEFQSASMFGEKKLFILKNLVSNEDFKNKFLKNIKNFANSENVILFYEKREIQDDKFFDSLKKFGKWQEFKLLDNQKLKIWVKNEFSKFNTKIEEKALNKLIEFVGSNLWQMENEIKKLVNYKNKKIIDEKDVEILVKPKIEPDIFETIDSLSMKNKKRSIFLIKRHLEMGESPLYLFSMINFQFRNLLIVKSLKLDSKISQKSLQLISQKLKTHPYIIKKTIPQAKRFTLEELKKIYQKIFEIDLEIKTGKIEPELALDLLVWEI